MSDICVRQPPLIDAAGNINVHGRSGISIPIKRYTAPPAQGGTEIDISGDSLSFEVNGASGSPFSLTKPDPNDPLGQLLVIADLYTAGIIITPGSTMPFVLRDTTGAVPVVRWEGQFIVRGWEDDS